MSQQYGEITLAHAVTASPSLDAVQAPAALHLIILAMCLVVLGASFVFAPGPDGLSVFGFRWPFGCRLYETFGIRCSLCGMSRSFCSLAHGDIASSVQFHRLGPAIFVLFCLEIPYRLYLLAAGPGRIDRKVRRSHRGIILAACVALLLNWLGCLGGLVL